MRDINKTYKKIDWLRWHKDKAFIRYFCAFSLAILLIVLFLMFPIVSDADTIKIGDKYFCNGFYDIAVGTEKYGSTIGSGLHYFVSEDTMQYYDAVKDLFECEFPVSNQINFDTQFDYAIFTKNGDSNKLIFMCCNACYFNLYDGNQPYFNANGGSPYYEYDITNKTLTRSEIDSTSTWTNINYLVDKFITGSCSTPWQTQNYTEVNYLRIDGICGKGSGGFDVPGVYPDESADNNLVLSQADYIFTHQNYYAPYSSEINTGSATPVGTITFKGQPNDYQLEHPEQFIVRLRFHFDYNVDYQNWNTSEFGYFKRTSQVLGNKKNLKIGFGNAAYDIPMSTFIQNKNSVDLTIKDVFDNLTSMGNTLSGLLAQSKEVTTISYNDFLITCYANIVSGENVSGAYIENYNFNSRKGLTTSKDIEDNKNPYTPNPLDQANNDPDSTNITPKPNVPGPGGSDNISSTNNSTTTTNGNGSVVINNNPTFNNNSSPSASATATSDGSGSILSHLIDTLFGNGSIQEGSIGGNTQEKLITNTGANNWLGLFSTTLGFLPSSLWAEITLFVGIILGILVVAFILRIILDFL